MDKSRTPVAVGQGQVTQPKNAQNPLDPVGLMVQAAQKALDDAGPPALAKAVDEVWVVNIISYSYADAPGRLVKALGLAPKGTMYGALGGNTPVKLFNQAAREIAAGHADCILIAGAEAEASLRRAAKGQITLNWPDPEPPQAMFGDTRNGSTDLEMSYDLFAPAYAYAIFENALAHHLGRTPSEHRRHLGDLMAPISQAAAQNPYSWSPRAYTPEQIVTPTEKNRMVATPYTLRMNPNLNVDMACAVLVCSEKTARSLGVDRGGFVYPLGGAELDNVWYITQRPNLYDSPAMGHCARLALERAGLGLADMDLFDFYSCFPSVIQMARNELGLSPDDPRPLSVTGGLAYFGGPGNNYSLHAIAALMQEIRENRAQHAMATGLGWFNTKHAAIILGKTLPKNEWKTPDDSPLQQSINKIALQPPVEKAEGPFFIEGCTILYRKYGTPPEGIAIGKTQSGKRAIAFMDPVQVPELLEQDLVGQTAKARHDREWGRNFISF
ncbi:MAG: acetyl-CoA acetyltransferase [Deltaproteobacteria bacterium]|nr:acetyl-CoA acetyltransferase [Deltaproteobacteria bacterium]